MQPKAARKSPYPSQAGQRRRQRRIRPARCVGPRESRAVSPVTPFPIQFPTPASAELPVDGRQTQKYACPMMHLKASNMTAQSRFGRQWRLAPAADAGRQASFATQTLCQ